MFEKWHDFYLMLGPSAGALIGLLFVVATLTSTTETDQAIRGMKVYTSPNVFHLGVVLLLSGLALAPGSEVTAGVLAVAAGVVGVGCAIYVGRGVRRSGALSFEIDFWCYGVAIGVLYVALAVSGVLVAVKRPEGASAFSGTLLLLLVMTVRNSWDLVSWMAPRVEAGMTYPDPPNPPSPSKKAPSTP